MRDLPAETSRTERWEITFDAVVDAGLQSFRARGVDAAAIVKERMEAVLRQAGVAEPNVRVRKLASSPMRGEWDQWTEYALGDIVTWHDATWEAMKGSVNRKPDSPSGYGYWDRMTSFALEAPTPALPAASDGVWPWAELEDAEIVDAEIVEDD